MVNIAETLTNHYDDMLMLRESLAILLAKQRRGYENSLPSVATIMQRAKA